MTNSTSSNPRIAFWGTSRFSVFVLEEMAKRNFSPSLIITAPPKPKGRKLLLSPSEVKIWADAHSIPTLEPSEIKSEKFLMTLNHDSLWDIFIVASYGKIIPRGIIDLPRHGTLNVHPSLLPKLRGPSPIQTAILEDTPIGAPRETGVTIMLIDEQVDHGDIIAQEKIMIENWPPRESELEVTLGKLGGKLLAEVIPAWMIRNIIPKEQEHENATFSKKITKEDAEIDILKNPKDAYRKICAFDLWPRAFFLTTRNGKQIRIVVTIAHFENDALILDRVIPEGKREMTYAEFLRGQK